jgi:serine/threonine protein kinase
MLRPSEIPGRWSRARHSLFLFLTVEPPATQLPCCDSHAAAPGPFEALSHECSLQHALVFEVVLVSRADFERSRLSLHSESDAAAQGRCCRRTAQPARSRANTVDIRANRNVYDLVANRNVYDLVAMCTMRSRAAHASLSRLTVPSRTQVMTLRYRAPEIMLGVREYNAAVDMWSVGCIMAEMVRGETPFKGDNEIDQLLKIFEALGTPNTKDWPEVADGENFHNRFPRWLPPASLAHVQVLSLLTSASWGSCLLSSCVLAPCLLQRVLSRFGWACVPWRMCYFPHCPLRCAAGAGARRTWTGPSYLDARVQSQAPHLSGSCAEAPLVRRCTPATGVDF